MFFKVLIKVWMCKMFVSTCSLVQYYYETIKVSSRLHPYLSGGNISIFKHSSLLCLSVSVQRQKNKWWSCVIGSIQGLSNQWRFKNASILYIGKFHIFVNPLLYIDIDFIDDKNTNFDSSNISAFLLLQFV